jgi:phage baseplate assembly protein W
MAIVLGTRNVIDLKKYSDYAVGIKIPIVITDTAFDQSFTTIDQVKTNIISLLKTRKRERLMQPELGSGLHELLFEQNDEELEVRVEETILNAMSFWLPFVVVDSIVINQSDEFKDTNRVGISITFSLDGNPSLETVTFNMSGQ